MGRNKRKLGAAVLILVLFVAAGAYIWLHATRFQETTPPPTRPPQVTKRQAIPNFAHIVIIVEENHGTDSIIGNSKAPYINQLANNYALATNYFAAFHPSLPNYLALTSGTNAGITSDCSPSANCEANVKNIADEIEASGRSWKAYEESMPAACTTHNSGNYAVRHDPFVYYPDISGNSARCSQHVVPFSQLNSDIKNETLPDYVFITPNVCNDMHNCSVATGDKWLKEHVPQILRSNAFTKQNSLLAITWDEAETNNREGNKVPLILAGPSVKSHYVLGEQYSHYSLLKTIEQAWNLKTLTKNDAHATALTKFFKLPPNKQPI